MWWIEEYRRVEIEDNQYNNNDEIEIDGVIECRLDNVDEKDNM